MENVAVKTLTSTLIFRIASTVTVGSENVAVRTLAITSWLIETVGDKTLNVASTTDADMVTCCCAVTTTAWVEKFADTTDGEQIASPLIVGADVLNVAERALGDTVTYCSAVIVGAGVENVALSTLGVTNASGNCTSGVGTEKVADTADGLTSASPVTETLGDENVAACAAGLIVTCCCAVTVDAGSENVAACTVAFTVTETDVVGLMTTINFENV